MGYAKVFLSCLGLFILVACDSPEERLQSHYEDGQELLDNGEDVKAALEFRNALQLNGDHVPSLFGLARIEEKRANWQGVANLLNKIVDLDPTHAGATIKLGRLSLLAGQVDRALELSNKALELAPDSIDGLTFRAAVLLNLDDAEGALAAANAVLAKEPNNADAISVLAAERIVAGEIKQAVSLLDDQLAKNADNVALQLIKLRALAALDDISAVEDVLNKLVELYPDTAAFRRALISLYVSQDRLDDAEAEIRAVAEVSPEELEPNLNVVRFLNTSVSREAGEKELQRLVAKGDSNQTRYRLALTQQYILQNREDEAMAVLQAIVDNPTTPDDKLVAKNQIAELLRTSGKIEESVAILNEIFEEDPKNSGALTTRAAMLIGDRKFDDAILDLRTVLRDEPDSVRAHVLLGSAHQGTGAVELADDQYARGFQASGASPTVGLPYAQFLSQRGALDRADLVLTQVVQRNPENTVALRALAQIKINSGDWVGAQQVAERLRELQEESSVVDRIAGLALQGQERFDQSIEAFERSQQAAPEATRPMASLVGAYVRAGQPEKAKSFLDSVLENDPDNAFAQILLAQVYVQEQDLGKAEELFQVAIDRSPESSVVYTSLAGFYVAQGNREAAEQTIDRGLEKLPEDLTLRLTKAGFNERDGDFDAALDNYQRLYEATPNSPIVANNFAATLIDHRQDLQSAEIALEAVQVLLNSNIPQFQDTVGWVYYRLGRFQEALRYLEPAAEQLPNLPAIRYHLGKTYYAMKNVSGAIEEFERIVELSETQDFQNLDEVKRLLEELRSEVGTFSGD